MTTEQQPQEDGQPSKTARPQDDFVRKEEKSEVSVPGTSREAETKVESASDDRGMSSVRDALGIFVGQNSAGNVEQTSNAGSSDDISRTLSAESAEEEIIATLQSIESEHGERSPSRSYSPTNSDNVSPLNSTPPKTKNTFVKVNKAMAKALGKIGGSNKNERNTKFHNLFPEIPEEENLIGDYNCALQKEILIQGRLYVTRKHFCFYSNILGWETSQVISGDSIVSIKKENTALFIPNAIQISLKTTQKFTFASFLNRDRCYRCLFTLWQFALMKEELSQETIDLMEAKDWHGGTLPAFDEQHLLENKQPGSPPLTIKKAKRKESKMSETGSEDSEEYRTRQEKKRGQGQEGQPPQMETLIEKQPSKQEDQQVEEEGVQESPKRTKLNRQQQLQRRQQEREELINDDDTPTEGSMDVDEVSCGCPDGDLQAVLHESIVPCGVKDLFKFLFVGKEWFTTVCEKRKTINIEYDQWKTDGNGTKTREIKYLLALDYSIGPKTAIALELQRQVRVKPGEVYVLETEVRTPHVPYGLSFLCKSRYCLTRRGLNESSLKVTGQVEYLKSVWSLTRAFIEKTSIDGMKSFWVDAADTLRDIIVQDVHERTSIASLDPSQGPVEMSTTIRTPLKRSVSMHSIPSILSDISSRSKKPTKTPSKTKNLWIGLAVLLILLFMFIYYKLASIQSEVTSLREDIKLLLEQQNGGCSAV
eukprot:m.19419 g.19419  ORF g.19419 m.19419 type:complete len:706 (+) comp6577_c0_seq1:124-2241(+)